MVSLKSANEAVPHGAMRPHLVVGGLIARKWAGAKATADSQSKPRPATEASIGASHRVGAVSLTVYLKIRE